MHECLCPSKGRNRRRLIEVNPDLGATYRSVRRHHGGHAPIYRRTTWCIKFNAGVCERLVNPRSSTLHTTGLPDLGRARSSPCAGGDWTFPIFLRRFTSDARPSATHFQHRRRRQQSHTLPKSSLTLGHRCDGQITRSSGYKALEPSSAILTIRTPRFATLCWQQRK